MTLRPVAVTSLPMALMLAKTYAPFKAAGVPDAEAQAAAEELAGYENRLNSIDSRLDRIESRTERIEGRIDGIERGLAGVEGRIDSTDGRLAGVEGRLSVLTWEIGVNAAATIAIFGMLFARLH